MLRSCLLGVYNNITLSPSAPQLLIPSMDRQNRRTATHTLGLHDSPVYYVALIVALLLLRPPPPSSWVVSELLINKIERDYPRPCGILSGSLGGEHLSCQLCGRKTVGIAVARVGLFFCSSTFPTSLPSLLLSLCLVVTRNHHIAIVADDGWKTNNNSLLSIIASLMPRSSDVVD